MWSFEKLYDVGFFLEIFHYGLVESQYGLAWVLRFEPFCSFPSLSISHHQTLIFLIKSYFNFMLRQIGIKTQDPGFSSLSKF